MFEMLSFKTKLRVFGAISFAMFLLMAVFGLVQLNNSTGDIKISIGQLHADIEVMGHVENMNIAFLKEVKLAKDVWMRGADAEKRKKYRGEFVDQTGQFEKQHKEAIDHLKELSASHAGLDGFISQLNVLSDEHKIVSGKYLAQIDAHTNTAVSDAKVAGIDRALTKQITELRDSFVKFVEQQNLEIIELSQQGYQQRRNVVIVFALLALVLLAFLGTAIIRGVLRQLGGDPKEVSQVLHVMATGNFSVLPSSTPVPGSLLSSTHELQAQLRNMIESTQSHTSQVNASANEIAAAVEEQAAITSQQSASLSEITATMEELSVSSSQIADSAHAVAHTSKGTLDESERGVEALDRLKGKMQEITSDNNRNISEILELDRKSKEIGKIMGIINDIADQTKMIAFNAAIEAASSGEAGKRFGVVAVEIRRLADNVTESTGEIESKIGEIQKSINRLVIASENGSKAINEGSQAVTLTSGELRSIVEGAKLASESAMQISLSTQQQKTASNQVLNALTEIDQGLHQSSASIRQTSAATHNLTGISDVLKAKLGEFKLVGDAADITAAAA